MTETDTTPPAKKLNTKNLLTVVLVAALLLVSGTAIVSPETLTDLLGGSAPVTTETAPTTDAPVTTDTAPVTTATKEF